MVAYPPLVTMKNMSASRQWQHLKNREHEKNINLSLPFEELKNGSEKQPSAHFFVKGEKKKCWGGINS